MSSRESRQNGKVARHRGSLKPQRETSLKPAMWASLRSSSSRVQLTSFGNASQLPPLWARTSSLMRRRTLLSLLPLRLFLDLLTTSPRSTPDDSRLPARQLVPLRCIPKTQIGPFDSSIREGISVPRVGLDEAIGFFAKIARQQLDCEPKSD